MNAFDKAFIQAYGQNAAGSGARMPLSAALELTRQDDLPAQAEEADTQVENANVNTDNPLSRLRSLAESLGKNLNLGNLAVKPASDNRADVIAKDTPPRESREVEIHASETPEFRPLLQVDSFRWPAACDAIDNVAGGQFDELAACVIAESAIGHKVIGFAGDCLGSGCTTLLLSLARRLSERCRVVIIDADRANPLVARTLGLLAAVGLKNVAAGQLPLDEALIESTGDHLTLLPYTGHDDAGSELETRHDIVAQSFAQLSQHYDLVLVDLGTVDANWSAVDSRPPRDAMVNWIDATLIVQDARSGQQADASRSLEILRSTGAVVLGIVENRTDYRTAKQSPRGIKASTKTKNAVSDAA